MRLTARFVAITTLFILLLYLLMEAANYYVSLKEHKESLFAGDRQKLELLLKMKKEHIHLLAMLLATDRSVIEAYEKNDPSLIPYYHRSFWQRARAEKLLYEIHFFKPPAINFYNFTDDETRPRDVSRVRGDLVWMTSTFRPSEHLMVCRSYAGVRSTYPIFDANGTRLLGGLSLGVRLEWLPEFLGEMVHAPVFLAYRLEALSYLAPDAYRRYLASGKAWNSWVYGAGYGDVDGRVIERVDFARLVQTIEYRGEPYFLTLHPLRGFRHETIGEVGVLHSLRAFRETFLAQLLRHLGIVLLFMAIFLVTMYLAARRLNRRVVTLYRLAEAFRQGDFSVAEQIPMEKGNDEIARLQRDLIALGRTLKEYYERLKGMIDRQERELEEARCELEAQMLKDTELGIANRLALERDLRRYQEGKLALLDIYRFKAINDTYGIDVGNRVLQELVRAFEDFTRECSQTLRLYRSGSDEFVLLAGEPMEEEAFVACVRRAVGHIEAQSFLAGEGELPLSLEMHAGVAIDTDFLLEKADIAVREAEKRHTDVYVYREEPRKFDLQKRNIEMLRRVRTAIATDRIVPFFQPIVDGDGTVRKYEALVRMIDTDGRVVPPGEFLEVVKNSKYYHALTRIVVQKSLEAFDALEADVSVNLSIYDLLNEETLEMIYAMVSEFSEPGRIVFELLESESMEGYREIHGFVARIRRLGARIAIDDFGTGYSNFSYLASLQPDFIKIDGSLIRRITEDEKSYQIVKSIVQFCRALGITTVAEFVSDEEIFRKAKALGIDQFQGYHFGAPAPAEEMRV